jgi:hypothetical protein
MKQTFIIDEVHLLKLLISYYDLPALLNSKLLGKGVKLYQNLKLFLVARP